MIQEGDKKDLYPVDIFVEYKMIDGKVGVVDTIDALLSIKTTQDENTRLVDQIKIDRDRLSIKKLMESQAVEEATSELVAFKITPSMEVVLDAIARSMPSLQLSFALGRISSKLELNRAKKLFTDARNDIKTHGQLLPITLNGFVRLAQELLKEQKLKKKADNITTLLFYAK